MYNNRDISVELIQKHYFHYNAEMAKGGPDDWDEGSWVSRERRQPNKLLT